MESSSHRSMSLFSRASFDVRGERFASQMALLCRKSPRMQKQPLIHVYSLTVSDSLSAFVSLCSVVNIKSNSILFFVFVSFYIFTNFACFFQYICFCSQAFFNPICLFDFVSGKSSDDSWKIISDLNFLDIVA